MEENRNTIKPNWPLLEGIAKDVYKDDIDLLTQADIKEIEDSIDNGTPFYLKEDESGEMNLGSAEILSAASVGFDAIQTVVGILTFWYTARKFNLVSNKEQAPDDKLNSEQIDPSIVEDIVKDIINKQHNANEKVEEELRKNGKRIIAAIVSHLKAIKRKDPKNDDKKEG